MPKEKATSREGTGLQKSNTISCTNASRAAAQCAYDTLKNFPDASLSITITRREKSEACSATTVTIESSDDIQTAIFSDEWLTTLNEEPAGSSPSKRRKQKERKE